MSRTGKEWDDRMRKVRNDERTASMTTPPSPLDPATVEACAREALDAVQHMKLGWGVATVAHFIADSIRSLATRPPEPTPPGGLREARDVAHEALLWTGCYGPEAVSHSPICDKVTDAITADRLSRGTPK